MRREPLARVLGLAPVGDLALGADAADGRCEDRRGKA